ncbi:hypothetical protein IWQ62_005964 [Dispira parvispora]|uniref:C2 domain-containing protein n=1 Tax=Dispira parvispora TaxID=1520584 RepID=A0A9W8E4R6_9FUNG|nr:hypothetical protein IWQ62_005964 [Dispira parvispora]
MGSNRGKLEIYVAEGRNLTNRDFFGKQDPFLEFTLDTIKKRTRVDKKGGSNPKWKEDLVFDVPHKVQSLTMRCFDRDVSNNDDIGSSTIDLFRVFEEEELHSWFKIQRKGKFAGEIYLEFTFTPVGGRKKPSLHHKLHAPMASMASLNSVPYTVQSGNNNLSMQNAVPPPAHGPKPFIRPPASTAGAGYPPNSSATFHQPSTSSAQHGYPPPPPANPAVATSHSSVYPPPNTSPLSGYPPTQSMSAPPQSSYPPPMAGSSTFSSSQMSLNPSSSMYGQVPMGFMIPPTSAGAQPGASTQTPFPGGFSLPSSPQMTEAPLPMPGERYPPYNPGSVAPNGGGQPLGMVTVFPPGMPGPPLPPPSAPPLDPPGNYGHHPGGFAYMPY